MLVVQSRIKILPKFGVYFWVWFFSFTPVLPLPNYLISGHFCSFISPLTSAMHILVKQKLMHGDTMALLHRELLSLM